MDVGGEIEANEDGVDFVDPFAALNYQRFSRSALLEFDFRAREADVESQFLDPDFESADLIVDTGTRNTQQAELRLVNGRDARFGSTITLGYRDINFDGTSDPDLTPETRMNAGLNLRFSIDPRIELRPSLNWTERSEDDGIDTVETMVQAGLGATFLINPAWSAGVTLSFREEETETTLGTTDEGGVLVATDVTRVLSNGQLVFSLSHDDRSDNTLTEARVARNLGLANGASLGASAGVLFFEDGDVMPAFTVDYGHEFLRGHTISLSLAQTGGENDDNESIFRTLLNATYSHQLTRVSRVSVNGVLANVNVLEGPDPDTLAASLGVNYTHDLTDDWALRAQASHRVTFEDDAQSDELTLFSINLERTFSFRP